MQRSMPTNFPAMGIGRHQIADPANIKTNINRLKNYEQYGQDEKGKPVFAKVLDGSDHDILSDQIDQKKGSGKKFKKNIKYSAKKSESSD